jgi:hypothetical protein
MVPSRFAVFAALLAISLVSLPIRGQTTPLPASSGSTQGTGSSTGQADCNGSPCEEQQPHVIVTLPAPAPVAWPWHDRLLWGAYLVLAIVGYVGIALAVSTLRKIERQTSAAENTVTAALATAQAALLNAQAIVDSERPWILVTADPSPHIENSFTIMATNRGRTPAAIISTVEQIEIAIDETELPATPEYRKEETDAPPLSIILLPGESTSIMPFHRDDLKGVCESDEILKRIVDWEAKVFIYGKIVYKDLISPAINQTHETSWCCWYIHGRQKSGLVTAGPPGYNRHT